MIESVRRDIDHRLEEVGRKAAVLADPRAWGLFLDIDGTLLGMAATPDRVRVPAGLVPCLEQLATGLGGAVALLTGRRIGDADRLFAPLRLVASGVHGTELRAGRDGAVCMLAPPVPASVVEAVNSIGGLVEGVIVEQKESGVALHYRSAPHAREALEAKMAEIVAASPDSLAVRRGRMVLEILPRGFSKATALTLLASRPPFEGRRPVMVGDDAGDESALTAAERLGGVGLRVAGEHFGQACADFDGVESVHAWLEALASRLAAHG
jgi:trehalose 6-phosphate phosphatase